MLKWQVRRLTVPVVRSAGLNINQQCHVKDLSSWFFTCAIPTLEIKLLLDKTPPPWSEVRVCENDAKIGFSKFSFLLAFLPSDPSPDQLYLTLHIISVEANDLSRARPGSVLNSNLLKILPSMMNVFIMIWMNFVFRFVILKKEFVSIFRFFLQTFLTSVNFKINKTLALTNTWLQSWFIFNPGLALTYKSTLGIVLIMKDQSTQSRFVTLQS